MEGRGLGFVHSLFFFYNLCVNFFFFDLEIRGTCGCIEV